VVIKLIANTAALNANLLSGDVDMVAGEGVGLTIDQVLALRKQQPDKFTYVFKPSLTYEHIDLKIENPILADLKVRQALLYALNRKVLVEKLFEGMQPVATSWVNPLDPNYTKDVPAYDYDPAKAKALLAEAGWKPGADGICRNDKGERLALEYATTSGNQLRELTQTVLKDQWKLVCVDAVIKNEPPRTLFGETLKKRTYTGMIMYAWSSGVGESPRRTLHSSQIPTAANNFGGSNAIAMNDPEMDRLIDVVDSELDPAKNRAAWVAMEKIYAAKLYVLPLFYRAEPHVIPKWLDGYTPTGHGDFSPLWAENWKSK
jgi:peptide/nickel transport system substrate-binding protein